MCVCVCKLPLNSESVNDFEVKLSVCVCVCKLPLNAESVNEYEFKLSVCLCVSYPLTLRV